MSNKLNPHQLLSTRSPEAEGRVRSRIHRVGTLHSFSLHSGEVRWVQIKVPSVNGLSSVSELYCVFLSDNRHHQNVFGISNSHQCGNGEVVLLILHVKRSGNIIVQKKNGCSYQSFCWLCLQKVNGANYTDLHAGLNPSSPLIQHTRLLWFWNEKWSSLAHRVLRGKVPLGFHPPAQQHRIKMKSASSWLSLFSSLFFNSSNKRRSIGASWHEEKRAAVWLPSPVSHLQGSTSHVSGGPIMRNVPTGPNLLQKNESLDHLAPRTRS